MRAVRITRTRQRPWQLLAAVLLALPLWWAAPPTGISDAQRYLDPAARIRSSLPPGESAETPPTWTTWVAYPIAAVETVRDLGESRGVPAARSLEATVAWTAVLRGLWAWLLALVLLEAASFAAAATAGGAKEIDSTSRSGRATWFPPDGGARAGLTTAVLLAVSPFAATAITHLLPAVPAAFLLFRLLRTPGSWRRGILAGMLLAWFGYLWPLVLLAVVRPAVRSHPDPGSPSRADLAWTVGIALFLALGLTPERMLHPLAAPGRFVAEWRREGGLDGSGGTGWLSVISLAAALGPLVWVGWLVAASAGGLMAARTRRTNAAEAGIVEAAGSGRPDAARRHRHAVEQILVPAAAVVLCLGLPVVLGVRRPGAVQWSVAPLLAAWAVTGAWSLAPARRAWAGIGRVLALVLVVSAISGRVAWQRGIASGARSLAAVGAEIGSFVPKGDLVVAEADPSAPAGTLSSTAGADSSGATAGYLILPRDSRTPGRYDDLYWHRWYAGFRWVLLSGARVSENLARADAAAPRSFYQAVEREGRLVREWGRGDFGLRLYRLPDDSPWHRPLSEAEIATLRPRTERAWFLSRLGSAYLHAGQLRPAEEIFRLATAWDPENPAAWNNLGAVFLQRGDYPAAAKAFDEGLKRAPNSFELLLNYGRACSAQGVYQRGEGYLVRAVNLRPGYAPAHYELGRVFLGLGKEAAAAVALRRTLELDPSTPRRPEIEAVLARLAVNTRPVGGRP